MDGMSMSMANMPAATEPMAAAATGSASMDMGGHDMSMADMMGGCKISMLWNWNTIDACFISESWKITSTGMFAGSCIGVVLLVVSLEFMRRLSREYERYIRKSSSAGPAAPVLVQSRSSSPPAAPAAKVATVATSETGSGSSSGVGRMLRLQKPLRPTLMQQAVRSLLHMVTFGVAYFVMLLAMYYNGYFIICILIGAFLGSFVFSWDQLGSNDATGVTYCCG